MEKFGLLQLLSSFAKNMQEDGQKSEQNILDVFMDKPAQNTPTTPPTQPNNMQTNNTIFTAEIRQKQFTNILLRHEEISRRIDRRNKH